MQKLVWQNSLGNEIDLTKPPYGITNWEGFSNTSLNIQSQQVPFQDGGVFIDALMEQRELSVTLAMQDSGDLEERYRMRRELIHALNPKLGEGYLIYTNNFTSKRIKCVAQIPLFETHNSNDSGTPKASLVWTACEPYWEDLEEIKVDFSIGQFPTIRNDGDVPTNVEIEITGTVNKPQITNETTGKKIKLNDIVALPTIINTENGKKTINGRMVDFNLKKIGTKIKDIAYSPELNVFCAVTAHGNIIYSKDNGEHWNVTAINPYDNTFQSGFNCIVFGKGYFIACGERGFGIKSSDGENWSHLYGPSSSYTINRIKYFDYLSSEPFVAVGDNGYIATFTNIGDYWSQKTSGTSENLYDVNYYYAIGANGTLLEKGNNWATWTSISTGVTNKLNKFISKNYIIGDGGLVMRYRPYGSEHITIFDVGTTSNLNYVIPDYVGSSENLHIILGDNGVILTVSSQDIESSSDVTPTFNTKEIEGITNENLYCGLYSGNSNVMVLCTSGGIFSTCDFEHCEKKLDCSEKDLTCNRIMKVGDEYFLLGNQGKFMRSLDLENWETIPLEITDDLFGITYGNGMYVLVGSNLLIATSEDLISWTIRQRIVGGHNMVLDIAYSEKIHKFCGVGYHNSDDYLYISDDGVTWTETPQPAILQDVGRNNFLTKVVYFDEMESFVMAGAYYLFICITQDLTNWQIKRAGGGEFTGAVDMIYLKNEKKVVVLSFDERSQNGFIGVLNENGYFYGSICAGKPLGIAYSEELKTFVFVCSKGYIEESSDIVTGYSKNITNSQLIYCLYSSETKKFKIIGSDGIVIESSGESFIDLISYLTNDSNMDFSLQVGDNKISLLRDGVSIYHSSTSLNYNVTLKYRQKYIGV